MAADSKGSFFSESIRDLYPFEELELDAAEADGAG